MAKKNKAETEKETTVASTLTAKEVNELIEVCISTPMEGYPSRKRPKLDVKGVAEEDEVLWGLPVLIMGEPGTAKTARVKQLARTINVKARSLFAAQHPPEDFSGALIPDGAGSAKQICSLAQIRELIKDGEPAIVFLDEINGAPPATQGAIQSFIHERVVGDERLPGHIRIIAAANDVEIATGGYDLPPALANRFVHVTDPGPTARDWISWLTGANSSKLQLALSKIEDMIADEWPNIYPESQALFAGFMESLGATYLHKRPEVGDPQASKAWPSHRTWDYALRAYTTARIMDKNDTVRDACLEACVGPAAATAFIEYANETDVPKPTDMLEGKWQPDKDRLDIIFAAYTGMVAYVVQRPDQKDKVRCALKAWPMIGKLVEMKLEDLALISTEVLSRASLGRRSQDPALMAAATKVLSPIAASGVQGLVEDK